MKVSFAAAVLLACSELALAQGKPALRVLVEGVGEEAQACGIHGPAVESAAAGALRNHGIGASTDDASAYLHVNVNAYRVMQGSQAVGCTTRLGVSVRGSANPGPRIGGFSSKDGVYVVLCEAARLLSGAQRDVAGAVNKALEEDIRSCLAQLNY